MNNTYLAALWSLLDTDATLLSLLGGHVFLGWLSRAMEIPCATITENNEGVRLRVGYNTTGYRDHSPTVQIDIWIDTSSEGKPNTAEDVEDIAARIDVLLFHTGIEGTRAWRRVSSSGPMPDEKLLHKALRYGFEYTLQDT